MRNKWTDPHDLTNLQKLIGRKVQHIHMDEDYLVFRCSDGTVAVCGCWGDCCSYSYFQDFIGVEKLLESDVVLAVEEIPLPHDHLPYLRKDSESVEAYGFRITSEHPTFGDVSSVFSFRNDSNGYYGGWLESLSEPPDPLPPEITTDVLTTEDLAQVLIPADAATLLNRCTDGAE